uniref:Purple acid phosphatase n=1 Tax=Monodon monoceros TaxID=40151 RepID=A0A8C6AF76_MONMO
MCSPLPCWSCCCLLLYFSLGVQGSPKAPSAAPEQVHLSYPGETGCMTVTWTTWVPTPSEVQLFGLQLWGPLPLQAQGTFSPFMDGGILWRKLYIHRITLQGLLPRVQYVYRCGSTQGWSRRFLFRALKNGPHWSPCLAVFGDIGTDNPRALPRLCSDTQQGRYDAVLHVGDFTYNVDQDNAHVRDKFMNLIEPVAASLPYVTCPGNHEDHYNFSNYKARFIMPGDSEGLWYSWDLGPVHIISFSTEVYFFLHRHLVERQFRWLESDLQKANKNPAAPPWIITMGHRPMYCSSADWDDCTWRESKVRRGLLGKFYELEDLFYKYGVDLQLWAHERSYEHPWPIYNYHVFNGSREMPYTHPRVPVHIITGSARCEERLTPLTLFPRPWSAVLIKEHGYTRLHNLNETRVHIQQVSDDQDGKIVDDVWVMRPLLGRMMYLW